MRSKLFSLLAICMFFVITKVVAEDLPPYNRAVQPCEIWFSTAAHGGVVSEGSRRYWLINQDGSGNVSISGTSSTTVKVTAYQPYAYVINSSSVSTLVTVYTTSNTSRVLAFPGDVFPVSQSGNWRITESTNWITGGQINAIQSGAWRVLESTAWITNFPTDYPDSAVYKQGQLIGNTSFYTLQFTLPTSVENTSLIGNTSVVISTSNTNRLEVIVTNYGTDYVYLSRSGTATTSSPVRLDAGDIYIEDKYTGDISVIAASGSHTVTISELKK